VAVIPGAEAYGTDLGTENRAGGRALSTAVDARLGMDARATPRVTEL
jgi:hypothetical protein